VLDVADHVRRQERTFTGRLTDRGGRQTLVRCAFHDLQDLVALLDRDHGPEVIALVDARTDLHPAQRGLELHREFIGHRGMDVEAVRGGASGAAVSHLGDHRAFHRGIDIRALEH